MSITIPTTGMEYTMVPDGNILGLTYPGSDLPYTWGSTNISWASCVPITGYQILARFRVVTPVTTPPTGTPGQPGYDPGGTSYSVSYPAWELVSQELTCTTHADSSPGNPFQQDNGLFVADPGVYGTAIAGIVDGTCYDYFKVFDESASGYIEPLSPYTSEPVEDESIPTTPYDPSANPPLYPIDALTKFVPDTRESVVVGYSLSTTYNLGSGDITDVVSVFHTVTQTTDDWSAQVQSLVDRSYYANGIIPTMPDDRDPPRPISEYPNSDGSPVYP